MTRSVRQQRDRLSSELRAQGRRWGEIAAVLREQWPDLTARQAMRHAHQLTQSQVLDRWADFFPDVRRPEERELSRWERWPEPGGVAPSWANLDRLARIYECSAAELTADVADYRHLDRPDRSTVSADGKADDVKRRDFVLTGAACATAAALPADSAGPTRIPRVTREDVAELSTAAEQLYQLDDAQGAGQSVLAQARWLRSQIGSLLDDGSYGPTIGRDLQVIHGQVTEMCGWLSYDGNNHTAARAWYLEALTSAHMTGSDELTTLILTSMSLQACATGNHREALDLSEAAHREARPRASARLTSLLTAREALTLAGLGDADNALHRLARAERLLGDAHPTLDNDPAWLAFWGPADLAHTTAEVHLMLGSPSRAQHASRTALAAVEPGYQRNRALYSVRLARALHQANEPEEAATVAGQAVSSLPDVSSGRIRADLIDLRTSLTHHQGKEAIDSYLAATTHLT